MTEKLYYEDSHMKEFDAIVLSCQQAEEGYRVVLDRTAFSRREADSMRIPACWGTLM